MKNRGLEIKEEILNVLEANNPAFLKYMRARATEVARQCGTVALDDIRHYVLTAPQPTHINVLGAVFRDRRFRYAGDKFSETESAHGRNIRVWALR